MLRHVVTMIHQEGTALTWKGQLLLVELFAGVRRIAHRGGLSGMLMGCRLYCSEFRVADVTFAMHFLQVCDRVWGHFPVVSRVVAKD
ncbi:MAG: hypothetical protein ACR2NZ_15955 [Rubripirellula sp.]